MIVSDISIIIVNYNVKDLLVKCLASIYSFNSNLNVEIIVVDNSSTDGSVEIVKEKFPGVKLIANKNNAGFPEANNQGIRIATGKYLFLLNPDTELIEDSLKLMMEYLERNPDVSLLAPQLLNADTSIQKSVFRFPHILYIVAEMFYLEKLFQKKYYSDKKYSEIFEIESAAGAALFFRKELTDEIGMLNSKLFWIEDIDFCFRIKKNGGRIIYFPLTRIIHYSGQSAKKNYNVSISNQVINKIKFYKLHGSGFSLLLVYLLSIMNVLVRLIVFTILAPFKSIYKLKMQAYWFTIPLLFSATKEL